MNVATISQAIFKSGAIGEKVREKPIRVGNQDQIQIHSQDGTRSLLGNNCGRNDLIDHEYLKKYLDTHNDYLLFFPS